MKLFLSIFIIVPNFYLPILLNNQFIKFLVFLFIFLLVVLFYCLSKLKEKKDRFTFSVNLTDLILLIFISVYIISVSLSITKITSLFGVYGWNHGGLVFALSLVGFFYFSKYSIDSYKKVIIFCRVVTLGALFSFVFYLINSRISLVSVFNQRISGPELHPIYYGVYLMVAFVTSFGLFIDKGHKLLKTLLTLFLFFLILASGTRSVWIALFLSSIVSSAIYLKINVNQRNYLIKNIKDVALILLLSLGIATGILIVWQRPFARIADVFNGADKDPSASIRLVEWKGALSTVKNSNFWFGNGPSTVRYTYPLNRLQDQNLLKGGYETPVAIRNLYLDYAANTGVFSMLIIVLFFAIIFTFTLRLLNKEKDKNQRNSIQTVFWAWLSLIFFHFFYHYTITSAMFLWAISAIFMNFIVKKGFFPVRKITIFLKTFTYNTSLFLCIFFIILFLFAVSAVFYSEIILASGLEQKDLNSKINGIKKSLSITPFDSRKLALLAVWESETNSTFSAQVNMKKAIMLDPEDANLYSNLGLIYYISYKTSHDKKWIRESEKYAKIALEKSPTYYKYADSLGQYYLAEGKLEDAEKYFRQAIFLKYNYVPGYYHLGEVYKQKGKFTRAKQWYKQSLKYWNNWLFVEEKIKEIKSLESLK